MMLPLLSFAQEVKVKYGHLEAERGVVPDNYNFWMYTPDDYDGNHKFPLVIFLHGASLSGSDLSKVRRYGVIDAIEKGKNVPAMVIAPQTRNGWNPDKINGLLDWVRDNYKLDETRVYVIGMSMGGYGTMDYVSKYPQRVAAAMALCGGCSYKDLDGLGTVPLWIMHGTADRAVGIQQSKRVVEYLQSKGEDKLLRYDWIQGGTHGTPARLFYLQKTYDWLFAHCKASKVQKVDRTFDITMDDIRQTYQELKWYQNQFDDD